MIVAGIFVSFFDLHSQRPMDARFPHNRWIISEGEAKDEGNRIRTTLNAEDGNAVKKTKTSSINSQGVYIKICI